MPNQNPEQRARDQIDTQLRAAGWTVQANNAIDFNEGEGQAVREYATDCGPADYVLFLDRKPVGVTEAKKETLGHNITTVENQTENYAAAKLKWVQHTGRPLPFLYEATGVLTRFTDQRDPKCGVTHITNPKSWVTDNALVCEFQIASTDLVFMKLLLNYLDLNKLSVSTAQPVVSGSKLNPLPIPLCSLPEQQEIVRLLDEQFTVIKQNEREIDAALKRSAALRQSILKKAFTGQLVPQDPADEPADEPAGKLLARIRAARATNLAPMKNEQKVAAVRTSRKT